jgi:hypothetical protein
MTDFIWKAAFILFFFSFIPWLIITTFLTLKLRKEKYSIINKISNQAPYKFRNRAKLMMESNLSWISASSAGHTWYSYLMLRYAWKIPRSEIKEWHKEIESIFGVFYKYYKFNNYLINVFFIAFPIMLVFSYFSRA